MVLSLITPALFSDDNGLALDVEAEQGQMDKLFEL